MLKAPQVVTLIKNPHAEQSVTDNETKFQPKRGQLPGAGAADPFPARASGQMDWRRLFDHGDRALPQFCGVADHDPLLSA